VPARHEGGRLGAVFDWIRANPATPVATAELARRAGMSERSFHRKVLAATGLTPGAFVLEERLRHAQALLEAASGHSLEEVAAATGFGSADSLRRRFRARFGVAPSTWRQRFAGHAGPSAPHAGA
jgi:AraC family transcriptional activator FtrA